MKLFTKIVTNKPTMLIFTCTIGLIIRFYKQITFLITLLQMLISIKKHGSKYHGKYFSYADMFEEIVDKDPFHVQFINVEDEKETTIGTIDSELYTW